ncbi:MAG: hypothetical protein WBK08_13295 [Nitrospira sp.]|nr:MAG: DUF1795 domain-containing protein [Nitrospira sp.]
MTAHYLLSLILIFSIGGCLPRQAKFSPVGAEEQLPTDQIWADWPSEWMTFRPAEYDKDANKEGTLLLLSKDGFSLQTITLTKRPVGNDFKHTQKKLTPGMLPQEAAEIVLDNVKATPQVVDLQIIENGPAIVAGAPGFKLTYTYREKSGLTRQATLYGTLDRDTLVTLSYDAVKRHYFQKDLATFEKAKDSLRWKS